MKINKQIIIILVLVSFLFSALGAAYYFYTQNEKTILKSNTLVYVYVAKSDIKKNTKITKSDIKRVTMLKKLILVNPLVEKEIIGRYATENIYVNDIFRKEKVAKKVTKVEKVKIDDFTMTSYNMGFKMFQNPNYTLKKGDYINIISAYQVSKKNQFKNSHKVHYIAKSIKVLGFIRKGKESPYSIVKETKTITDKKNKKKTKKVTVNVKADELILDIDTKTALALTDDLNRGKLLWMSKTHKIVKPVKKVEEPVKKVEKPKKVVAVKSKITKKYKPKVYPVRLYKPKSTSNTISATIHYGDKKQPSKTKKHTDYFDGNELCKKSEKFLIVTLSKALLRTGNSTKNKIERKVTNNYIIPYIKMVDNSWYKTCDGLYVHKISVKTISKKSATEKLKNKPKKVTKVTKPKKDTKKVLKKVLKQVSKEVKKDDKIAKTNKVEKAIMPKIVAKKIVKSTKPQSLKDIPVITASTKKAVASVKVAKSTKKVLKNKKYLLTKLDEVLLRRGADTTFKIIKIIGKGQVLEIEKKVNDYWYKTTDGLYVHKMCVDPIDTKRALKRRS